MNLSIIGLGWLGNDLARQANSMGCSVCGSVTTASRVNQVSEQLKISVEPFNCYTDSLNSSFFLERKLIINIAAGRKNLVIEDYVKAIINLVNNAVNSNVEHIIFISTTAVFGNLTGTITNRTKVSPVSKSAIAHCIIEDFLMTHYPDMSCVIRLGGLIGPNPEEGFRHPIFQLSKRGRVSNAQQPTNLVHKKDVINTIFSVGEQSLTNSVVNLTCGEHPSKKDYYTWCAKQLSLPIPAFEYDGNEGKVIDSSETLERLSLKLEYPTPYDMLAKTLTNQ